MKTDYILTIAGNDVLSGGGMQADLATFTAHSLYGFVAQTCLTAVTEEGFEIIPVATDIFQKQLDSLAQVPFVAIKVGLLPNEAIAQSVLDFLKERPHIPVVLDPVLVFKENADQEVARMGEFMRQLFPLATVITPNLKEAQLLSQLSLIDTASMEAAAVKLQAIGAHHVVIKGGARLTEDEALDVLVTEDGSVEHLCAPLLKRNNQGAGCTFASAIASGLARGLSVVEATRAAKDFVYQAIAFSNDYGVTQYEKN